MHLGPRDLKEDGDSAKQKGGLGICKACSRWQVRLGGGGSSALTVGDCAQGWRRDRCYIESSAPCLSIYLFMKRGLMPLSHPDLQSSAQLWVLKFCCKSLFWRVFSFQSTAGSSHN